MTNLITANGLAVVTVPAGQKIAVLSNAACVVYTMSTYPNFPSTLQVAFNVPAGVRVISSTYSVATQLLIAAGSANVQYDIAVTPIITRAYSPQPTPTAKTTTVTLTIAELQTRIITGTHAAGATQTYTLPTGTLIDAAVQLSVDDSFDWVLINLSAAAADTITVAAGTDHTVVGNMVVQSANATTGGLYGNSAMFRTRKTAANTYVTYRIG